MKNSFFFFFLTACAVFQSGGESNTRSGTRNNTNGNCKVVEPVSSPSANLIDKSFCADLRSIACDKRQYGPAVKNGQTNEKTCVQLQDSGELCIHVQSWGFNTENLRKTEDAKHFVEGGSLNYQEFICYFTGTESDSKIVLQGRADSLTKAIEDLRSRCR